MKKTIKKIGANPSDEKSNKIAALDTEYAKKKYAEFQQQQRQLIFEDADWLQFCWCFGHFRDNRCADFP